MLYNTKMSWIYYKDDVMMSFYGYDQVPARFHSKLMILPLVDVQTEQKPKSHIMKVFLFLRDSAISCDVYFSRRSSRFCKQVLLL